MGFTVQVQPGRDLTTVRRNLRQLGDRGLSRQLSAGLQRAAKPLKPAVQKSAASLMPSGYGPTLSKSLRVRTQTRERRGSASVQIRLFGEGKGEKRDIPTINRGTLRHPVFGRRKKAWVAQKVKVGFVDRPADQLGPAMAREMQAVVEHVADLITKG